MELRCFTMASNHVLSQYSTITGTSQNKKDLNLSTLVLHGNKVFSKDEWSWNDSLRMAELQAMSGQTIQIGCRIKITEPNFDCWYNFTFTKLIIVYCLWGYRGTELLFEFMVNIETSSTVKDKKPLPLQIFENEPTQPPIGLTPSIFNTGPYIIKNVGQQQILFNPSWSLKRVELALL